MSIGARLAVACVLIALTACGDGATGPSSLSFGRNAATVLLDDSLVLSITRNGRTVTNSAVTWRSSAQDVATVDAKGIVRSLATGTATISAAAGSATAAIQITVAPHFVQVATGGGHACGITGQGQLYCWGSNINGELGTETSICPSLGGPCSTVPIPVHAEQVFVSVATGDHHTCGLTAAGAAYCWGANYYGQLGGGGSEFSTSTPVPVAGGLTFEKLSAGRMHTCGITTGGETYCWGWDHYGQLGSGSEAGERCTYFSTDELCSRTPVRVVGDHRFAVLVASDRATCGMTAAGEAYCWGMEVGGSDGTSCQGGTRSDCTRAPVPTPGSMRFAAIGIGQVHTCGRVPEV